MFPAINNFKEEFEKEIKELTQRQFQAKKNGDILHLAVQFYDAYISTTTLTKNQDKNFLILSVGTCLFIAVKLLYRENLLCLNHLTNVILFRRFSM